MVYLSDEELSGLKNYKYNVVEDSIAEKLMNPFWNWAVRLLPMWMAPNLVTLIGLLIVVGSSMLFLPFDLEMKDAFPTWTYFVSAAAVFTYMTMDVLDGKQARRTGSSSPLGQMFDHGCDAWSCNFLIYLPLQIFRIGLSPVSGLYYFALTGIFYAA
jgi:phosphatidylglycerophosphate synthase